MYQRFFVMVLAVALTAVTVGIAPVHAQDANTDLQGRVIKMRGNSTLYYVGSDGKRYVYPNAKTYFSWFNDFSVVEEVDDETLYSLPLGGNVRYRPGVVLVKIQTSPKVYAVGKNGLLRWVKTEAVARALYGENWAELIDDVPDSFFTNYTEGDPIDDEVEYDPDSEAAEVDTVDANWGRRIAQAARKAHTTRCRVITRVIDKQPGQRSGRAVEALTRVQERFCQRDDDSDDDTTNDDVTAPVISDITATTTATSTVITWTTDEEASSKVEYATESLDTASEVEDEDVGTRVLNHSVTLEELATSTTYYFRVTSEDEKGNTTTSNDTSFTTAAE